MCHLTWKASVEMSSYLKTDWVTLITANLFDLKLVHFPAVILFPLDYEHPNLLVKPLMKSRHTEEISIPVAEGISPP